MTGWCRVSYGSGGRNSAPELAGEMMHLRHHTDLLGDKAIVYVLVLHVDPHGEKYENKCDFCERRFKPNEEY